MRVSIIIILFLCSSFLLDSCKKYHQDPFLSARTVKARLTGYWWFLEKLTVNGIDSTEQRRQMGTGCHLKFPAKSAEDFGSTNCNGYNVCWSGWSFDEDKDLLFRACLVYPQVKKTVLTYHIIKLFGNDLIFEVTHPNSGRYYLFEYNRQQ